jgi:nitrite reductase/ring-hydroxylating ferredoxin subunit
MASTEISTDKLLALCPVSEVEPDAPRRVVLDALPPLAVFQLDDGYYVTADTCTHGEASLCDGFVEGGEIECPWHAGKFCIRTGEATAFPAVEPIAVYRTHVVDGQVCIEAPADIGP